MSLTMGSGPLGHRPAGRFNVEIPVREVLFVDPSPRWIRAVRGGETVIDSRRAKMLHQHGVLARYFFPREDVRWDRLGDVEPISPPAGAPRLDDHVAFPWDDLDAWFEEDEQLIAHAIDPYHRVDVRRTSRHVVVSAGGAMLADTRGACALFESGLPTRWYVPREHVLVDLEPSGLLTECAYKGVASYFSTRAGDDLLENIAWSYPQPRHDATAVRDLVCVFNEAVDLDIDGELQERPETPWGGPRLVARLHRGALNRVAGEAERAAESRPAPTLTVRPHRTICESAGHVRPAAAIAGDSGRQATGDLDSFGSSLGSGGLDHRRAR